MWCAKCEKKCEDISVVFKWEIIIDILFVGDHKGGCKNGCAHHKKSRQDYH